MFFNEDVPPERRDEIIDYLARRVVQFGMETPAVAFLEMNKPVTWLASQLVAFFEPYIGIVSNPRLVGEIRTLMQDRSNIDRLQDRIEELAEEQRQQQREERQARRRPPTSGTDQAPPPGDPESH